MSSNDTSLNLEKGTSFKIWLMAFRPKTLTASVSPVIFTFTYIYFNQQKMPSLSIGLTTLFCALLMQIGTNLVNDYFDGVQGIDKEDRLGPTRVVSSGLIPPRRVQFAYQICFFLAFLIGSYLMSIGGLPIVIIGISSLIFAYAYTGGPMPLSRVGMGELLAFLFFGPVACIGTAILLNYDNLIDILAVATPLGFWSAALMSVNNLRDINTDLASGKRTIATLVGETKARYFTLTLLLFPVLITLALILFGKLPWHFTMALLSILPLKSTIKRVLKAPIDQKFNNDLANTGKSLTIFTIIHIILFTALSL